MCRLVAIASIAVSNGQQMNMIIELCRKFSPPGSTPLSELADRWNYFPFEQLDAATGRTRPAGSNRSRTRTRDPGSCPAPRRPARGYHAGLRRLIESSIATAAGSRQRAHPGSHPGQPVFDICLRRTDDRGDIGRPHDRPKVGAHLTAVLGEHSRLVRERLGLGGEVGVLRVLRRDAQGHLLAATGDPEWNSFGCNGFGVTIAPSTW